MDGTVLGVADEALARPVLELSTLLQSHTTDKSACIDSIRFQVRLASYTNRFLRAVPGSEAQ
jgi:hypothetical protein